MNLTFEEFKRLKPDTVVYYANLTGDLNVHRVRVKKFANDIWAAVWLDTDWADDALYYDHRIFLDPIEAYFLAIKERMGG